MLRTIKLLCKSKSYFFKGCGPSDDIPYSEKEVTTSETTGFETEVKYTCQNGYALYPEYQNSVINCADGAWGSTDDIRCLKSKLMLFNIKTSLYPAMSI